MEHFERCVRKVLVYTKNVKKKGRVWLVVCDSQHITLRQNMYIISHTKLLTKVLPRTMVPW